MVCKNRWQSCVLIDGLAEASVRDLLFHIDCLSQSLDCESGTHLIGTLERETLKIIPAFSFMSTWKLYACHL